MMTSTRNELTQGLIAALDELIAVHEEQKRSAEESRQKALGIQTHLMQKLQVAHSGTASEAKQNLLSELDDTRSDHTLMKQTQRRWAVASVACDRLLMRLYAFPEARNSAENIAEALQAIRLVDVIDEDEIELPAFDPEPYLPPPDANESTREELRPRKFEMALDFFAGMDEFQAKVQQRYDIKIAQTEQWLKQAKAEAERLLAREELQT